VSRDSVREITLEESTKITKYKEIKEEAKRHFQNLYTEPEEPIHKNLEDMLEHIPDMIIDEDNRIISRPSEEDEVRRVIWSLHLNKAPCLDGFLISLYRFF
jgi:hypothetical protein